MDELDHSLLVAWNRVVARCRRDPAEAARRARRRCQPSYAGPPRAWCLALRAGDTRILPSLGSTYLRDAAQAGLAHTVRIDGALLRKLCAPVRLDWPGVRLTDAAARLGRDPATMLRWLRRGTSQLRVRHLKAQCYGHFGKPVPEVWSPVALDPGARVGEPPHPAWGCLWQTLSERLPADYQLRARRVPSFQSYPDGPRFRQWYWLCPGRPTPRRRNGRARVGRRRCGRRSRVLFAPLPVFTLDRALRQDDPLLPWTLASPAFTGTTTRWRACAASPATVAGASASPKPATASAGTSSSPTSAAACSTATR